MGGPLSSCSVGLEIPCHSIIHPGQNPALSMQAVVSRQPLNVMKPFQTCALAALITATVVSCGKSDEEKAAQKAKEVKGGFFFLILAGAALSEPAE